MRYKNFMFETLNGTKHFFRWNPSAMDFVLKKRTLYSPLDGLPLVHTLDSTEAVGQMVWEAAPRNRPDIYDDIVNLVGKTGILYNNSMPVLVGRKNLVPYSSYNPELYPVSYWNMACLVGRTYISDGSAFAPDGISMVYAWKRDSVGGTGWGCMASSGWDYTLAENNVLSVHFKEESALEVGLNLYLPAPVGESRTCEFTWDNGVLVPLLKHSEVDDYGVDYVKDGWYRAWVATSATSYGHPVGTAAQIYIYPHREAGDDGYAQETTFIWGVQLEEGATEPTWYAHTTGQPIIENMMVQFLDLQTEQLDTHGTISHRLVMNFKVISENL